MLSRQLHWVFDMQLGRCGLVGPRVAYQAEKMNNIFKSMGEKKTFAVFFGHSHSFPREIDGRFTPESQEIDRN